MTRPAKPCDDCGRLTSTPKTLRCRPCHHEHLRAQAVVDFWDRLDRTSDCWVWTGDLDPNGYGRVRWQRKHIRAHRLAWAWTNGPIPAGLFVLHRCDNPPCVRPDHLFVGTNADNMRDMVAKGRFGDRALRGSTSPNAKLTEALVAELRARRAAGESLPSLARLTGVSAAAISNAVRGVTWAHVR